MYTFIFIAALSDLCESSHPFLVYQVELIAIIIVSKHSTRKQAHRNAFSVGAFCHVYPGNGMSCLSLEVCMVNIRYALARTLVRVHGSRLPWYSPRSSLFYNIKH